MDVSRFVYIMEAVQKTTNLGLLTLTGLLRQLGSPITVLLEAIEEAFQDTALLETPHARFIKGKKPQLGVLCLPTLKSSGSIISIRIST